MKTSSFIFCLIAAVSFSTNAQSQTRISVRNSAGFSQAMGQLRPGTTLLLQPGTYSGGIYLRDIAGNDKQPIVIQGADANNPPVFEGGGSQAFHLANCSYVTLKNMMIRGFSNQRHEH